MREIHSNQKIEIEQHFKVSAGPGAGKTHWLIGHIRNVLRQSRRLAKTAKVGCITFTNTGVDEIRTRLGGFADRVEVATIHSFLYNNIVRPYAFLLKDENGRYLINLRRLNGHDEHIPSPKLIFDWETNTNQYYLKKSKKEVYDCLMDLDWRFDASGQLILYPRKSWKLQVHSEYSIRRNSLFEYKRLYWNKGQIHHEDVLYFAYRLVIENSELLGFVRAKYPYIFIDEFQDTHPIQTAIIKKIAEERTVVGVIGDPSQSIYKFQGAERQDFIQFSLPNMSRYFIKGNRRSTVEIINLLNRIRGDDIEQSCIRNEQGPKVKLLIGDKSKTVRIARGQVEELVILARNNEMVGQIKNLNNERVGELWDNSRVLDSNYQRQALIHNTLHAVELAFLGNYQEARREVSKLFRFYKDGTAIPKNKRREYSIMLLQRLIVCHKDYLDESVCDYNNAVYDFIKDCLDVKIGAKITRGIYKKEIADQHTCRELIQGLRIKDDTSWVRTIHKAKGAQFNSVLIVLENERELKHITEPDVESVNDDSRVYYVALSRAKDNLYISVPGLSAANRKIVEALDIEIEEL